MVKVLSFSFEQCFSLSTILLVEEPSETGLFREIFLTMSFRVRKFKNRSSNRLIFFSKMFKTESKIRKCKKKLRNYFPCLR